MKRLVLSLSVAALGTLFASCSGHGMSGGGLPSVSDAAMQAAPADVAVAPVPVRGPAGDVRIAVALPLRNRADLVAKVAQISDPTSPSYHHFLTREFIAQTYAPRASDLQAVAAQLQAAGFSTRIGTNAVFASAPPATVESFFGTKIGGVQYTDHTGRVTTQAVATLPVRMPQTLSALGANVIGLDDVPPAETFSRLVGTLPPGKTPDNLNGSYGPYFPPDLKQAYRFPSYAVTSGAGVTIAIVMSAEVRSTDINHFAAYALFRKNFNLTQVAVDGGGPLDTGEATLDVEQSAGIAPNADIVLYDVASLSYQDVYDGYNAAYNNNNVLVVNSSFGFCEQDFNSSGGVNYLDAVDSIFLQGSAAGMTWVAASGDFASHECSDSARNVSGQLWPASDPNVLAVGGTDLETTHTAGNYNAAYVAETAYEDSMGGGKYWGSGGGYSAAYARPSWQAGFVSPNNRGIPDVSLNMGCCPAGAQGRTQRGQQRLDLPGR